MGSEVQGDNAVKGFIEVTGQKDNSKRLINIWHVEEVADNYIYLAFNSPNSIEQDYVRCKETYEEIKQKIKEAVG